MEGEREVGFSGIRAPAWSLLYGRSGCRQGRDGYGHFVWLAKGTMTNEWDCQEHQGQTQICRKSCLLVCFMRFAMAVYFQPRSSRSDGTKFTLRAPAAVTRAAVSTSSTVHDEQLVQLFFIDDDEDLSF